MMSLYRRWTAVIQDQYLNPFERRRAIGLTIINFVLMVATVIGFVAINLVPLLAGETIGVADVLPYVLAPVLIAVSQRLVLDGNVRLASWILTALMLVGTTLPLLAGINGTTVIVLSVPVITAGLLLDRRDLMIAMSALLFIILFAGFNQSQNNDPITLIPAAEVRNDLAVAIFALGVSVAFLFVFGGSSEVLAETILEDRRRLEMMKNRRLAGAPNVDTVLARAADLLMDDMLYTYAQVYLIDANGRLNAHIRTGMGTRHSVTPAALDSENAIRQAVRRREVVLVSNQDVYETRSHLLPSVTHALALPLMVDDRLIGVLDIQSSRPDNPFVENEALALELLAADLAYAISQVRELNELRQVLETRETANERLEAQIYDLRRRLEYGVGSDWTAYVRERGRTAFGFDLPDRRLNLQPASDLPEHLKAAMTRGEVLVETRGNEQIVNLPIRRYDDVLGAMSFSVPLDQPLTDRQIEMANAVANRLAAALETARLVEQTRSQAERERKAGEISSLLLGQQEVHAVLEAAAQSFNDALGAVYTRIYLEPEALQARSEEAL